MNAPPVLPGAPQHTAAEAWLGERLPEVLKDFDRQWLQRNRQPWEQRYQYVQEARGKLMELERKEQAELTQQERWNLAAWTEEFVPDRDALPLYRAYAEQAPEDRDADFAIGRILLGRNDTAGIAHLERAMEKFNLALPACEVAYDYFVRVGETNLADAWRRRGERFIDVVDSARAERASLSASDTFLPAALSQEARSRLEEQLALVDRVKHAWIARKKLTHAQEAPLYVIAIEVTGWFNNPAKVVNALAETIQTEHQTYFVATSGDGRAIGRKVAKVGDLIV
jgi:hypothetical protein